MLALMGSAVGVAAVGFASQDVDSSKAAGPNRLFLPQISQDEVVTQTQSATLTSSPTTSSTPTPTGNSCPGFRSAVANFSDAGAASVNQTAAPSSVSSLRSLPRPAGSDFARTAVEGQFVTLQVQLAEIRQLPDRTIQVLVSGDSVSTTMMLVFPFHTCLEGANAADQPTMNLARVAVTNFCGTPKPGESKPIQGAATVSGVPFFGPTGGDGAPNGIELRPVFNFQFTGSVPCDPLGTPLPSTSPTGTQPPSATATETVVPFVHVTINGNGAVRGGSASYTVEGGPNHSCSLTSASAGTIAFIIGVDGRATGSWPIPLTAATGPELVTVTCGALSGTATLFIS